MFSLWCEWDCGQESVIFTTEENAKGWFNTNLNNIEAFQQDTENDPAEFGETPFDYYETEGLVGVIELKIIA